LQQLAPYLRKRGPYEQLDEGLLVGDGIGEPGVERRGLPERRQFLRQDALGSERNLDVPEA
jgi:hypothetical protein